MMRSKRRLIRSKRPKFLVLATLRDLRFCGKSTLEKIYDRCLLIGTSITSLTRFPSVLFSAYLRLGFTGRRRIHSLFLISFVNGFFKRLYYWVMLCNNPDEMVMPSTRTA